jgi:alpha-L-fucosidase
MLANAYRFGGTFAFMILLLAATVQAQPALPILATTRPIADGPFQPSWDSLKQYHAPQWFADAKFGIWAHWTAQCVPERGDWYAQYMYREGGNNNKFHIATYGHPSKFGFKDIDNIWHAENWDPDKLMALYKRAGAQYFVALANHHDNFDCFDSAYQPWNSVNIGPKKDIVGVWAAAARKNGLRFGVTEHCARAWSWFEITQGADKQGPFAGIPYDGKLTKADGKGLWWDGLDPQDLYAQNHPVGMKINAAGEVGQAYCDKFLNRTIDLIDKYHPDLLYFDDSVLPLNNVCDAGLKIAAHYYNSSIKWHDGQNEAVMNTKGLNEQQRQCLVWDIERGLADKIEPFVWQTDTCIGQWHYNRDVLDKHTYKSADTVIHMLADIVSKNGNLLLNIPVKGDGTIDTDEVAFLEEMAKWMDVNSECIVGTRPWVVYGEGPSTLPPPASTQPATTRRSNNFNEGKTVYTAEDIRFTTKGDALYVIAMGWPSGGTLTVKSLAKDSGNFKGDIGEVQMLGVQGGLKYERDDKGLTIDLPIEKTGDHAYVFKVTMTK